MVQSVRNVVVSAEHDGSILLNRGKVGHHPRRYAGGIGRISQNRQEFLSGDHCAVARARCVQRHCVCRDQILALLHQIEGDRLVGIGIRIHTDALIRSYRRGVWIVPCDLKLGAPLHIEPCGDADRDKRRLLAGVPLIRMIICELPAVPVHVDDVKYISVPVAH